MIAGLGAARSACGFTGSSLQRTAQYVAGVLEGETVEYDEGGRVRETIVSRDGKPQ